MDDYRYRARRILIGYSPGLAMMLFLALGANLWDTPAKEWDFVQAATFFAVALFVAFFPGAVSRIPLLGTTRAAKLRRLLVAGIAILASEALSFAFPERNPYCFIPAILNGFALGLGWMPEDDDDLRRRARGGMNAKIRDIVDRVRLEWGPGAVPVPTAA